MKTKRSIYINELGLVPNDDPMLLFIFSQNFKLNKQADIKFLEKIVLIWIKRVTTGRTYAWQQDSMSNIKGY